MKQPLGYDGFKSPKYICKLNKSLYGLKLMSIAGNHTWVRNFVISVVKAQRWWIVVSSKQVVYALLHDLLKYFAANDLGELHYFLGTKVRRIPKGIVHT
jgi:hypothetical protein